jgi:hypothetical protein
VLEDEVVDGKKFKLPKNIERYLAALSKLYAQEGHRRLQEIVVNAQTRVVEEWSYDNLDGGTYGHAPVSRRPRANVPVPSVFERVRMIGKDASGK